MYIIAVSNEKGGVAKTTTTISLGATLAEIGKKTLLIDLDPQANLTLALGFEPAKIRRSIANVMLESAALIEAIQTTSIDNFDVVPSKEEMGMAERFLPMRIDYEYTLKKAIEENKLPYEFILIDCPPSLGVLTTNSFVVANLLLIPTQAEFFSIYALRNIMSRIRQARKKYNSHLTYRLLLTMYDQRNRSHRILSEQLKTSFDNGLMETIIGIDTKLRESPIAGVPIIYHAPKTRASIQYRALAREIIEYVKETAVQPA